MFVHSKKQPRKAKPIVEGLWHYTVGIHMPSIAASGELRLTSGCISIEERPAVWFSSHPQWENTACKGPCRNMKDTAKCFGGAFRIGIRPETAPHNWEAFKELSGIDPAQARGLEQVAAGWGASHEQWRVSFEPVLEADWVSVEKWNGSRWVEVPR